jgi:hypothetical protein
MFSFSALTVKRVFKTLELVGWYATGKVPTQQHLQIHTQVSIPILPHHG